ncbi:MAG: HlyD family efflux transporter periplasmic adaptor subunit [Haliscomenobacter sp.]|nr:HlyD family efflux transporter periplasmic adaptor subunit [Haliscomenobacter sp.]
MPSNHPPDSELLQDFLTTPPGWLLRSGMGVLFSMAVAGFAMTWFIRYPDQLEATATVRTSQAPVDIFAPGGGRIDTFLSEDQQFVRQGQGLCMVQNAAKLSDIIKLERLISGGHPAIQPENQNLQLGEIQSIYAAWLLAKENLYEFTRQAYTSEQIRALEKEVASAEELSQALQRRKALYQEELALAAAEYERSRKLHLQHVISDQELEAQKTKWLQARRYAQSMEEEAIQNRIRSGQLRTQQANLMAERQMGMEERTRSLQQATLQVKGAIDQWRHQYVLTAPIDGMLSWKTGVSEGQYLPGGASPGTIIPAQGLGLVAMCAIPVAGAGRVRPGNQVLVDLDAFPPEEFGRLEGKVKTIARLPDANREGAFFYQIEAALPDTLRTSYGKILPFRQNMTGTARIFTKDRRLLERLLGKILEKMDRF